MSVAKNERAIGTAISFAILHGDEFVGEAALYAFDCRGGAEMAIRVLPEYQGKGYSGDALTALFEVCRRIGLIRLYAEAFAENKASIRVMQKCGLTCEGILRQADYSNRGIVDACMYAILAEDWFKKH